MAPVAAPARRGAAALHWQLNSSRHTALLRVFTATSRSQPFTYQGAFTAPLNPARAQEHLCEFAALSSLAAAFGVLLRLHRGPAPRPEHAEAMEGWPESAAFPGLPPELTDDPLRGFIDFGGLALPPAAHEAGAATVPPPPLEGGFSLPPLQFEAMPPDGFSVPMPPLPPGQADTRMPPSELYPTGSGGGSSGGGGGGGSGGGVLAPAGGRQQCTAALTEEAKLERSRAQNRAKQARFRERQKVGFAGRLGRWGDGRLLRYARRCRCTLPTEPLDASVHLCETCLTK